MNVISESGTKNAGETKNSKRRIMKKRNNFTVPKVLPKAFPATTGRKIRTN